MSPVQESVSTEEFLSNKPVFEEVADSFMAYVSEMPVAQVADILKISNQLAIKTHNLAYDFPHKLTGYRALFAFTGEAYRGLDITSISEQGLNNANDGLRIISSVYGLLKSTDFVKPYRCEFNKPIAPGNKTPIQVFKSKNTIEMVNLIKQKKITEIIDLLPADADKCIDWKIVRAFASVYKVCFQQYNQDGSLKTPIASRLKELRGKMARFIFENNIDSFSQLCRAEAHDFVFSEEHSKSGLPVFIAD